MYDIYFFTFFSLTVDFSRFDSPGPHSKNLAARLQLNRLRNGQIGQ